MTKKDYELIARAIKAHQDSAKSRQGKNMLVSVAMELVKELEAESPLFDRNKFYDACGM